MGCNKIYGEILPMKKFLASLLLSITSCSYGTTSSTEINSFVKRFSNGYPKQHNLTFDGVGLSIPNNNLRLIDLSFVQNKPANIEEARIQLVRLIQKTIEAVNEDKNLRPLMTIYPFTENEVELRISFCEVQGDCFNDPSRNIYFVFNVNGKVVYYTRNSEGRIAKIFEEPYSEAVQKANAIEDQQ
jgi:hypothetical protein